MERFIMFLVAGVVILGVFFFICCVNYSFQKVKWKSRCVNRNYYAFNSPKAWISYSIITAFAIALLFAVSLSDSAKGFSSMFKAASDYKSSVQAASTAVDESADDESSGTVNEK
jgi:hypothetical protein